jgi:hypothetical protein
VTIPTWEKVKEAREKAFEDAIRVVRTRCHGTIKSDVSCAYCTILVHALREEMVKK